MASLELNQLGKDYEGHPRALDGIDLRVEPGELVTVLGPSGCGKSTLLRLVAGLERPTRGTIRISGADVGKLAAREREVAITFQENVLLPHLSVEENIALGLKLRGVSATKRRARAHDAAERLRIATLLQRRPHTLSGGERQRVALARALLREPKLFLLDEPFSQIDARLRSDLRNELRSLHDTLGATMLFVTHDPGEALALGDRVVVLREGLIEQAASPRDLYARPASAFVADFVGSPPMNLLACRIDRSQRTLLLGDSLTLPLPEELSARSDRPLLLGIRAEDIEFAAGEAPSALPATVLRCEAREGRTLVRVDLDGNQLELLVATEAPRVGDRLRITLDPTKLHLFDAATGKRIG